MNHDLPGSAITPPSLHWAIVLGLTIVTFGLFAIIWVFRQAWWARRIDENTKAIYILAVAVLAAVLLLVLSNVIGGDVGTLLQLVVRLGFSIAVLAAYFDMRAAVEVRYNITLSGLMTFFFNVYYLQYHLRRIARGEYVQDVGRLVT